MTARKAGASRAKKAPVKKKARKAAPKAAKKKSAAKKAAKKKSTAKKSAKKKATKKKAPAKPRSKATVGAAASAPAPLGRRPSRANDSDRRVYFFGDGRADGRAEMKELLGGKGANLAEMTLLGVPVPPGFTISTEACSEFEKAGRRLSGAVKKESLAAMANVEKLLGRRFGDPAAPLLVSVRSGARVSMPGMMDTVLNLGLNETTVVGLAKLADERFAYDSYRRFVQMYGDVVLGVPHDRFEDCLEDLKVTRGVSLDTELRAEDLRALVGSYKRIVEEHTGRPFPQDPQRPALGRDRRRVHQLDEPHARSSIATSTPTPPAGAPPSTSRRWSSATWATTAPPAWPSRATRPRARRTSTAST